MTGQTSGRLTAWLTMVLFLALTTNGCAWLHEQERRVIYRPTPSTTTATSTLPAQAQLYFVDVPGQNAPAHISLWWLPQPSAQAPTVLYLHGTFRNLQGNQRKIEALHNAGFAVLALDYRGWGTSTVITPSEASIMQDTRLAWAELVRRQPLATQRVIYGHSMGSAAAVALASHLPAGDVGALVLESAFTSFADVAQEAGFLARVLNFFNPERFDSLARISQINAPLLMLHGKLDGTVPISLGKRLFDAAPPPKQWLSFGEARHSDIDLIAPDVYRQTLQAFMRQHLMPPQALSVQ